MADIPLRGLTGLSSRWRVAALALAGAAAGLGHAPISFPWLTLAALWLIYGAFAAADDWRAAARSGWIAGVGYFALSLSWIVEPFFVDPARHGWMAPFAILFSAGGFALFWALGFGLAHRLSRPGVARAAAWACALTGTELLRTYLFTGFPWALIGHVWIGWPPMQLAALLGAHGLTLLTLLLVGGLSALGWPGRAALLAPFAAVYAFGAWQAGLAVPLDGAERPSVRLVQPNAEQHLKWDPILAPQFYRRLLDFTDAPGPGGRPDLVVWPETALPWLLNDAGPALTRIAEIARGAPVVLGLQRRDGRRAYNSLVVVGPGGQVSALYDKHHLVPFGEFVPFGWLLRPLGIKGIADTEGFGFSAGPGPQVLDLAPLGKALPLICYEAIFARDVLAAPERPDWLLQITNDAWFGKISGPHQHLAQARLRAVETGLPLLRAANTGVSAVIDARGRVTAQLGLGEADFLDAALPPPLTATLYWRTGDLPLAVLMALGLLATGLSRRRPPITD